MDFENATESRKILINKAWSTGLLLYSVATFF
jgi:hypothetical protein